MTFSIMFRSGLVKWIILQSLNYYVIIRNVTVIWIDKKAGAANTLQSCTYIMYRILGVRKYQYFCTIIERLVLHKIHLYQSWPTLSRQREIVSRIWLKGILISPYNHDLTIQVLSCLHLIVSGCLREKIWYVQHVTDCVRNHPCLLWQIWYRLHMLFHELFVIFLNYHSLLNTA